LQTGSPQLKDGSPHFGGTVGEDIPIIQWRLRIYKLDVETERVLTRSRTFQRENNSNNEI
jgi:hypothetical protein